MREILFRGKLAKSGKWSEGNLVVNKRGICIITPDETPLGTYGQVIPETVGQYTGLTDKYGKKIFVGDIIEVCNDYAAVKKAVAVVKFGEFTPKFFYKIFELYYDRELKDKLHGLYLESNKGEEMFFCSTTTFIRVIGNIHDNPELLRGEQND